MFSTDRIEEDCYLYKYTYTRLLSGKPYIITENNTVKENNFMQ